MLASVATAYIIHTDLYFTGNRALLILLCAMFCVALFVAFRVIDEQRWGGVALSAAALLGLRLIAGGHSASVLPVSGDVTNIRQVSFLERPNLYFVSFEAMAPRSLLDKYLDLETTKFHDLFEAKFRRFPNFFANAVPTINSLNLLLALDVDVYTSMRRALSERGDNPDPHLFSGQNPSPLLGILHKNGYETTSIYKNSYFGKRKGPYIDNYFTFGNYADNDAVCTLLDPSIRDIAFWGFCSSARDAFFVRGDYPMVGVPVFVSLAPEIKADYISREPWQWERSTDTESWANASGSDRPGPTYEYTPTAVDIGYRLRAFTYYVDGGGNRLKAITEPAKPVAYHARGPTLGLLTQRLKAITEPSKPVAPGLFVKQVTNDRPQFVMAHLDTPGHVDRSFRYDNVEQVEKFRAQYLWASEEAARSLELIIRSLEENDPDGILLVYGDHGPFLSQGLKFEDNPEFVVQDNYGVLGGVYPPGTCAAWFNEGSAQGYMTILDAVHTILRCLSGGESAIEPRKNTRRGYGPIPWDANLAYKDFLYE